MYSDVKSRIKELKRLRVPKSSHLAIAVSLSDPAFHELTAWIEENTPHLKSKRVNSAKGSEKYKDRYKKLRVAGYSANDAQRIANSSASKYKEALEVNGSDRNEKRND